MTTTAVDDQFAPEPIQEIEQEHHDKIVGIIAAQIPPSGLISRMYACRLTSYGHLVRELRIIAGATLLEMSKAIGRSTAELSGMEVGRMPLSEDVIQKTADFFQSKGVPVDVGLLRFAALKEASKRIYGDTNGGSHE